MVGDYGVGKTSLILSATQRSSPQNPPTVLPKTIVPKDNLQRTKTTAQVVMVDTSTDDRPSLEAAL